MDAVTRKQHLTDLEFSDLLAAEVSSAGAQAHLASCEHCQRELDLVQSSMGSFLAVSTAWAQAEAPARVPVPSFWSRCLGARPSWGAGLAAVGMAAFLAVGLGVPARHAPAASAVAAVPVAPSNTELADDNRLMLSISQELTYRAQPAVPAAELQTGARRDSARAGQTELD